jgi:dTDP-4-amino-4,6-dideoxygalactose transaminase
MHHQPAFRDRVRLPAPCPVSEEACDRILSLPMYPEWPPDLPARVAAAIP